MSSYFSVDSSEMMYRADELMEAATNRYKIVVQVAKRAKRRRYDDLENNVSEHKLKPVIQAVIEMSDELTEPEIISDGIKFISSEFNGSRAEV